MGDENKFGKYAQDEPRAGTQPAPEPTETDPETGTPIPVADPTRPGKAMSDPVEEGDEPEDDDEEETEEDEEEEDDDKE